MAPAPDATGRTKNRPANAVSTFVYAQGLEGCVGPHEGVMQTVSEAFPAIGEVVDGKYRIERLLGQGGMGAVARASHVVLGGAVALKFMHPQYVSIPGAVERFINEGRASKAIRSDHVLPVTDVGLLPNGAPYLVMECLIGCDLSEIISHDGRPGLPVGRSVHFVIQILRGLQAAHAIGIVHRDMKPSNCFVVTHDGEPDFVKILDFGISKVGPSGEGSLTQTHSTLGTPLYMSPEQARSPRDVDARSDLYSVGVILYELLSGKTPFETGVTQFTEILFKLFTTDPPHISLARPDLPDALAEVVHHALSRSVESRYQTALEFASALAPFAEPAAQASIVRMRAFVPPSQSSVMHEGLPTSMEALAALPRADQTLLEQERPAHAAMVEPTPSQPAPHTVAFGSSNTPRPVGTSGDARAGLDELPSQTTRAASLAMRSQRQVTVTLGLAAFAIAACLGAFFAWHRAAPNPSPSIEASPGRHTTPSPGLAPVEAPSPAPTAPSALSTSPVASAPSTTPPAASQPSVRRTTPATVPRRDPDAVPGLDSKIKQ